MHVRRFDTRALRRGGGKSGTSRAANEGGLSSFDHELIEKLVTHYMRDVTVGLIIMSLELINLTR